MNNLMEEIKNAGILSDKLEETFKNHKEDFQPCEDDESILYLEAGDLDYNLEDLLIDISQPMNCNWSVINVLCEKGWEVFAGDKDSFGWLVGIIEPSWKLADKLGLDKDKTYRVCYG